MYKDNYINLMGHLLALNSAIKVRTADKVHRSEKVYQLEQLNKVRVI